MKRIECERTAMEKLDETASLISASKVTGTDVYNTDGEHLGVVHDIMLDKRSGKIAYALMSFGGFLGIGERYGDRVYETRIHDYYKTAQYWSA
jgi:sporulation protein YlmC with PRC-barrel domain